MLVTSLYDVRTVAEPTVGGLGNYSAKIFFYVNAGSAKYILDVSQKGIVEFNAVGAAPLGRGAADLDHLSADRTLRKDSLCL